MDDRRDGEHDCGDSRRHHGCDERHHGHDGHGGPDGGPRGDRGGGPEGRGPDTRFLQLEMSQVLYGEAEELAQQAFRQLLAEAAKERLRERLGNKITELAQLAVDELMKDLQSSLDIEARIQEHSRDRGPTRDRLRAIFAEDGPQQEGGEQQKGADAPEGAAPRRKGRR